MIQRFICIVDFVVKPFERLQPSLAAVTASVGFACKRIVARTLEFTAASQRLRLQTFYLSRDALKIKSVNLCMLAVVDDREKRTSIAEMCTDNDIRAELLFLKGEPIDNG